MFDIPQALGIYPYFDLFVKRSRKDTVKMGLVFITSGFIRYMKAGRIPIIGSRP